MALTASCSSIRYSFCMSSSFCLSSSALASDGNSTTTTSLITLSCYQHNAFRVCGRAPAQSWFRLLLNVRLCVRFYIRESPDARQPHLKYSSEREPGRPRLLVLLFGT